MRLLLILLTSLLVSGISAQGSLVQEFWPDGSLRSTCYSEAGRMHFINYYENGRVKEMGGYLEGKRDGLWNQYSDTGILMARATFRNGVRQGVWEFRTAEGRPLGTLRYSDGLLAQGELLDDVGELVAQRDYR